MKASGKPGAFFLWVNYQIRVGDLAAMGVVHVHVLVNVNLNVPEKARTRSGRIIRRAWLELM